MSKSTVSTVALLPVMLVLTTGTTIRRPDDAPVHVHENVPIPAFARQYRTACSTCHTAAPKLNVLGEAFRLNGYRMPANDLLIRHDDPIPLGNDAWKDLWPRAIWPGELPGQFPLALRIQNDLRATRDETATSNVSYRFPNEVYLLAGTTLGENISVFVETEWSREGGVEVVQAKFEFQDLIPGLPKRLLNLWVGMQNPYLFTFADRQIDRAARQRFQWQDFRPSNLTLVNPLTGAQLTSTNDFRLRLTEPSVEVNGLVTGRLYYGVGIAQGAGDATSDNNNRKDIYYKVRYKFGGLDLAGKYGPGQGPVTGAGGQLLDRSVTIEHFGYFGAEPAENGVDDTHRSFGINARALYGSWDVGIGFVRSEFNGTWPGLVAADLVTSSVFAKVEYLGFPWLIGSLKLESFQAEIPDEAQALGFTQGGMDQVRVLPGLIALLRQNVRAVIEGELFARNSTTDGLLQRRPHNLWLRLDVAF